MDRILPQEVTPDQTPRHVEVCENTHISSHGSQGLIHFLKNAQQARTETKQKVEVDKTTRTKVMQIFSELDGDKDGLLSRQELEAGVAKGCLATNMTEDLRKIILDAAKHADQDDDGLLDVDEFMTLFLVDKPHFIDRHHRHIQYFLCLVYFVLAPCLYIPFNPDEDGNHWSISDALYFATVTVTTVGYGDFGPKNAEMKLFTVFYILFGLTIVASVVSDCVAMIVAKYEEKMQQINEIMIDGMKTAAKAAGDLAEKSASKVGWGDSPNSQDDASDDGPNVLEMVTAHIDTTAVKKLWFSFLLFATPVVVGTIFFKFNEDWDYVDSFYWSVVTCTTVGYGDMSLEQPSSRTFSIFFILMGFGFVAAAIGNVGTIQMERAIAHKKREFVRTTLSSNLLKELDTDGKTGVDRSEFICAMLLQLGKCTEEDLLQIIHKFAELDADNSGYLTKDDLRILRQRKQKAKLAKTRSLGGILEEEKKGIGKPRAHDLD